MNDTQQTDCYILCHDDGTVAETWMLNTSNPYEHALQKLQFRLDLEEDFVDSDEVKSYRLVDESDDDLLVTTFYGTWYESACITALSELGFTLWESLQDNVITVKF